jgi:hypothetical protein
MEAFATYLIKSVIWLTGFAIVYLLFLRNERYFMLKRIYLISGIFISFIFPIISFHYQVEVPAPAISQAYFIVSVPDRSNSSSVQDYMAFRRYSQDSKQSKFQQHRNGEAHKGTTVSVFILIF